MVENPYRPLAVDEQEVLESALVQSGKTVKPPVQPLWDNRLTVFEPATQSLTLVEYVRQLDEARKQACLRGARLQVIREWLESRNQMGTNNDWTEFCREHPVAAQWFDENGVPK